ncbi:DNA-binding protein [Kitasatospora sp. NPDC094028]
MEPILVTAREASLWTGRPVGTIWRWASERRISRHETPCGTRYDLRELPAATDAGPGAAPALPEGCAAA